jgi:hypothetical protein
VPRRQRAPRPSGEWKLEFASNRASKGWAELKKQHPKALRQAYDAVSTDPRCRTRPRRQWPLKGQFTERSIAGRTLEQWQYEVTGSARIWYCIDDDARVVWVTLAKIGHPKETD